MKMEKVDKELFNKSITQSINPSIHPSIHRSSKQGNKQTNKQSNKQNKETRLALENYSELTRDHHSLVELKIREKRGYLYLYWSCFYRTLVKLNDGWPKSFYS